MLHNLLVFLASAAAVLGPVSAAPHLVARDSSCEPAAVKTVYLTTTVFVTGSSTATSETSAALLTTTASSPAAVTSPTVISSTAAAPSPVAPTGGDGEKSTPPPPAAPPSGDTGTGHGNRQYKNALYFTNWGIYGANYQPQSLPVGQITHILYAFADIGSDGTVKSSDSYADVEKHYDGDSWNDQGHNAYGCVKQLFLHKKQNRHLKLLLSIGGWTWSAKFAPVAATDGGRRTFCSSAVTLMSDWGFDGIDFDWEYPASATEARDFVSLLRECRQQLDAFSAQNAGGYHFQITVATSAGPLNYDVMDLPGMDPYVDAWHLMAYDYAGSWDSTTGHQANLFVNPTNPMATKFSTEKAVSDYTARGVAADKIVLGLPLYGRSFEATTGIGQPYNGIGDGSVQSGVWWYKALPKPGAAEMFDETAVASYSYDPASKELISYDTIKSADRKVDYLRLKGLGGAVYWEASGDRSDDGSLVVHVAKAMGPQDDAMNLLSYPKSQYDNIRAGLP